MGRSESVRESIEEAVANGRHPGNYPLGYRRVSYDGPVEPDPAIAPAIRAAFRLRAKGHSLGAIARLLSELGVKSSRGGELSRQAVRIMLTNPFYIGSVRLRGVSYSGLHSPVVSLEEFDRAQRADERKCRELTEVRENLERD